MTFTELRRQEQGFITGNSRNNTGNSRNNREYHREEQEEEGHHEAITRALGGTHRLVVSLISDLLDGNSG